MSNYAFNYSFNVTGNCNAVVQEISENVGKLRERVEETTGSFAKMEKTLIVFNQAQQYFSSLESALKSTLAPGAELNYKLAELEAIAAPTAEELALVEKCARNTAKEFGVSAAGAVESYKLLLSQLSPELTKNGEALNHMGKNVATLSKMMGNDATAAAEVLTTAMNQYGVSLDDPLAASDRMWEMMNTMAAAAREGSAELPAIKEALSQCGMAAKAAGVSFEETNAAIQVLDKAGKKGSEGGVALRNVMSTLAQGRFLPKDVREELAAAGIKVSDLTDKSKSLAERLEVLKPVMADDALFSKLFGKENSAAAMALVQGIPKVQQWTEAITGTTTAIDQSEIVMATYQERLARVQAKFDDFKISIFNSCGDLGIWTQVVMGALVPLSQLVPLIYGAAKAVMFLKSVNFAGALAGVTSKIRNIIVGLTMMNTSITVSGGYWVAFKVLAQNVCRSIGVAIMNIPIVGWIAAAITAVIAIIQQLWDKCYGFRVAVFTAWEGIKAIFSYAWELLKNLGQTIADFFIGIWNGIKSMAQKVANVFMAVVNKIKSWIAAVRNFVAKVVNAVVEKVSAICKPLVTAFKNVANAIKGFFGKIIDWVRDKFYALINWFIDKYNWIAEKLNFDKIARLGKEAADRSWAKDHPEQPVDNSGGGGAGNGGGGDGSGGGGASPIGSALGGVGGSSSKETDRVKNINIQIERLIDKFTITTNNLSESKERIKDAVAEALLSAVNDANYAFITMQQYSFDIINARFIASGVAVQAKGLAYRLRFNKDRDDMRQEDYQLGTLPGYPAPTAMADGKAPINRGEEAWQGSGDYWLGRTTLTDVVVNVPEEGLLLMNDVTVNVSLQKEIVKTALVGRAGTIKEYITDGDYQLSMSVGIAATDGEGRIIDQYPERAVAQLREILERPEALEVSSAFLDLFGITHIVVTGFTAKQMTHSNRQVIEITALSDREYVIESTDY